jgi:UPF0755 protein
MNKIVSVTLTIIVILIIAISAFLYFFSDSKLSEKLPIGENQELLLVIPRNATIEDAIEIANKKKLLEPNIYFVYFAKVYSKIFNKQLFAGTYRFTKGNTNMHIIRAIFSGEQQYIVMVTFPEGLNIKEYASIIKNRIGADSAKFVSLASQDSILRKYNIEAGTAEGCLMPNTYQLYWKHSELDVLTKLLTYHKKMWDNKFTRPAKEKGWSKQKVLTMASIIQSETPINEEMPVISGVYHNRLARGWKLEADPTVQFAIGSKKRLYYKDLNFDSPYNTYKYAGLPPGPINSPGEAAIWAALKPERNDYMYFVAIGDGSSRHLFAKTRAEHLANVAIYKKNSGRN